MKHCSLFFFFFILCSTFLYGQDNILICSKKIPNSEEKINRILQKSETYIYVDFVDIKLDKILEYEEFLLQFDERIIAVRKEKIEVRGINNFVFVGRNNKRCQVLISVLGDDVQGVIEIGEEVYTIETIGDHQYALIMIDHSTLREACDNLDEETYSQRVDTEDRGSYDFKIDKESSVAPSSSVFKSTSAQDCKIRVLVLYTQNAQSSVSNIKNTILTAVALTNQSFVNSLINYRIELVYAGQTDYVESGFSTDLSRFKTAGDGYMDDVHALRDKYSADVCVLLINDSSLCGKAAGINVSAANAFCIVSTYSTCATTNYSFGHEIGHLLGCRHDPFVDNSSTPFSYGHGYVHPSNTWRTIMAYTDACGSCPRLLYWSNPNVIYEGDALGTYNIHNNARVWNERSDIVIAFRQPDSYITFASSDIPNTLYADVVAKQEITTSGTVDVNSGNTLYMRAGNSINLQPNFSVQVGAEFSAGIEDVYDCEECASTVSKVAVKHIPVNYDTENIQVCRSSDFSYTVFPDSSNDFINITCPLANEKPLSIKLLDLFGKEIKEIQPQKMNLSNNYTLQIPVYDITTGACFLTISSKNHTETLKININK